MGNSNLPSFDPTPDDLIDNLCYEIVHRLFGIERMWLSNKSWLTDFEPPPDTLADPTNDVLNGIAYDAAHDRLFVTGKCWPKLYEIRLTVPEHGH